LLEDLDISGNPCSGCEVCNVKCSRSFMIKEKITDISRLLGVPSDFLS